MDQPQTQPQAQPQEEVVVVPQVKPRSTLAISARSALGLAAAGAILGGLLGAGGLAAAFAIGGAPAVTAIASIAPFGLSGLAAGVTGATGSALAGLAIGSAGGAVLGAPAGAIAGPIYVEKKMAEIENAQLKAAMPAVAEEGARMAIANVLNAAQQAMPEFDNEFATSDHVAKLAKQQQQALEQANQGHAK